MRILFAFTSSEADHCIVLYRMLVVEVQQKGVDNIDAEADNAEIIEYKVQDAGKIDRAQVGQHGQEEFELKHFSLISEQNYYRI